MEKSIYKIIFVIQGHLQGHLAARAISIQGHENVNSDFKNEKNTIFNKNK